jgi:hypothetical protein
MRRMFLEFTDAADKSVKFYVAVTHFVGWGQHSDHTRVWTTDGKERLAAETSDQIKEGLAKANAKGDL